MALGGVDLNLLVTLQALLEEGNVTRAGLRVGMPQPAMSTALARLRRHYKDELLVKAGNGYTLTPFARSLLPEVRESTRSVGFAFSTAALRPPDDGRVFTASLSSYSIVVFGRLLQRRIAEQAPGVSLKLQPVGAELPDSDRGQLQHDLVTTSRESAYELPGSDRHEVVCRDRFVCVADPGNPLLRNGRLSLADLAALPHAVARPWPPGGSAVAAALHRRGVSPKIAVTAAGWLPLPFLVSGTDLVAAMPERLARQLSEAAGVTVVEPPFGTVDIVESAWWHPLHATDLGLMWLRGVVAEVAASLTPLPALPEQRQCDDAN